MNIKLRPKLTVPNRNFTSSPNTSSMMQSSSGLGANKSNFQQKMQVKKLMAAREAGGYAEGSMLERRLNQKIANLAATSYGTNTDRLKTSLQRQSDQRSGQMRGQQSTNFSQSLREKIQSKATFPNQQQAFNQTTQIYPLPDSMDPKNNQPR